MPCPINVRYQVTFGAFRFINLSWKCCMYLSCCNAKACLNDVFKYCVFSIATNSRWVCLFVESYMGQLQQCLCMYFFFSKNNTHLVVLHRRTCASWLSSLLSCKTLHCLPSKHSEFPYSVSWKPNCFFRREAGQTNQRPTPSSRVSTFVVTRGTRIRSCRCLLLNFRPRRRDDYGR